LEIRDWRFLETATGIMEYGVWDMDYERIEIKRRDWRQVEIRGMD